MSTRKAKESIQRKLNFDAPGDDGKLSPTKQDQHKYQEVGNKVANTVTRSGRKRAAKDALKTSPRVTSSKQSQSIESYLSPKKKGAVAVASSIVVTPAEGDMFPKRADVDYDKDIYVPSYIHENVQYISKAHMSSLSPIEARVYDWIMEQYEIPKDLEQNRKYGPLSGSTYADRVNSAYRLGSLKRANDDTSQICTVCASLGHDRDHCPTLV
jgi:hypothetical protein